MTYNNITIVYMYVYVVRFFVFYTELVYYFCNSGFSLLQFVCEDEQNNIILYFGPMGCPPSFYLFGLSATRLHELIGPLGRADLRHTCTNKNIIQKKKQKQVPDNNIIIIIIIVNDNDETR